MQSLSELLTKAEAKGVKIFTHLSSRDPTGDDVYETIFRDAASRFLALRGWSVTNLFGTQWYMQEGSTGQLFPLGSDSFESAVLAAFDRELDSMEKPNESR